MTRACSAPTRWRGGCKVFRFFRRKRPGVLGLALGSGGAKGMAHLGALRAFAEHGIVFDVVAGTSAGALVGSMVAGGYSSRDIAELLRRVDVKGMAFSMFFSKSLNPVRNALDDMLGELDFSELKKPFAAVATDTESGAEVILREGNVARAVTASCAIPPYFKPVEIDGTQLADGAFSNAVPGDVAHALGADLVVGISLSPVGQYRCVQYQTAGGKSVSNLQSGYMGCDIMLEPDLSAYSATSVLSGSQMQEIGYACAEAHAGEILEAMRRHRIPVREF